MPGVSGMPSFKPIGPSCFAVPPGTCQTILRVSRSMALMVPNGGCGQGTVSGDMYCLLWVA